MVEKKIEEQQKIIDAIAGPEEKQRAQITLDVQKAILYTLPELNYKVTSVNELKREEIKEIAIEKIRERLAGAPQQALFAAEMIKDAEKVYEKIVDEFKNNIIEIPRITIQQSNDIRSGFRDFDLDTNNLNYQPVSEEILIRKLREQENSVDIVIGKGRIIPDVPERILVNELMNYPEVNYDEQSDLLFKLTGQAIGKFRSWLDADQMMNVVQYHKREIGRYIYSQLMENFYCEVSDFEKPVVKPFTRIEEHNLSKYTKDSIHQYTDTITPTSAIPGKVFCGFRKACHNLYKFDSKTEKDFAIILENEAAVLKWLRPVQRQFHIYWRHNSRQYHPDFVVETADTIYMVETKKEGAMEDSDVQEKTQAALQYCKYATEFTTQNSGKQWRYVLIPHNMVQVNMSFNYLVRACEA